MMVTVVVFSWQVASAKPFWFEFWGYENTITTHTYIRS